MTVAKKKKYKVWGVRQLEMIMCGKYTMPYLSKELGATNLAISSIRRDVNAEIAKHPKVCLSCLHWDHGHCTTTCACPICWTPNGQPRPGHVQNPKPTPRRGGKGSKRVPGLKRERWTDPELYILRSTLEWSDDEWDANKAWVCDLILPRHKSVKRIAQKRQDMLNGRSKS